MSFRWPLRPWRIFFRREGLARAAGSAPVAVLALGASLALVACASREAKPPVPFQPAAFNPAALPEDGTSRLQPVIGWGGMVVADDAEAAELGAEALRQGGNAVDAAFATWAGMAVSRPHFAALGGGGFLIHCPKPKDDRPEPCEVIDFRESAPAAATRDLYVREGKARTDLSQNGALASGVPGMSAGFLLALEKHGRLGRKKLLAKPIEWARDGIRVSGHTEEAIRERWAAMNPEARRIFGRRADDARSGAEERVPLRSGDRLIQRDLAEVLKAISSQGAKGFYEGWVTRKIAEGIRAGGGILTEADLAGYRPVIREPVRGEFRGMEIVTMPPPSAGGALILMMLRFTELADRDGALAGGFGAASTVHALAHGMRLAFADRAMVFGDPGFVRVPLDRLLSLDYLRGRWRTFSADSVPPLEAGLVGGEAATARGLSVHAEGDHTTHLSVIDREGNAVAATITVNDNFGSGFVPPGTGVVMNNEMDDFSIQPGVANLFGLVGAEANAIAPGKRPLSSMSPTVVRDSQGRARLVLGAAGGPRITTSVYQTIVNRLYFGMSLPDAVAAQRLHHQWKPDELKLERGGFPAATRVELQSKGYAVKETTALARMHALERFPDGRVWGVPDRRAEGAAAGE